MTLITMLNLARVYKALKRTDEARRLYQDAVEAGQRVQGRVHPHTLRALNNVAAFYRDTGQWDEAVKSYAQSVDLHRKVMRDGFYGTGRGVFGQFRRNDRAVLGIELGI